MAVYSRSTQYAIRAMSHLALAPPDEFTRTEDLASSARVPLPYLTKISQALARQGLLQTLRGRGGGLILTRPAEKITLEEIVDAVEGNDLFTECLLGLESCEDAAPCPVHHVWKSLKLELMRELHEQTLADLAQALQSKKDLIEKRRRGKGAPASQRNKNRAA